MDRVSMPTGRYHGMAKSNIAIIVVSVALVVFAHIVRHESIHVSTAGWVTIHPLRHMSYFSDRIHSSRGDWFGLVDTRHMLNFHVRLAQALGRGETEEVLSTSLHPYRLIATTAATDSVSVTRVPTLYA